ncbi:MAG TPA: PTS sugar transporter subunit IIA [Bacillota bacterium]|nr:PTS sugar transporter subunit IIA [Bacillota bacterium]
MIGFVITGHGSFPNGILQSVQLIAGDVSQVEVVSFEEDTDKLHDELEAAITKVDTGSGVVCFADLAGGTPFNVSSRIASTKEKVRVIGGTNSPMLLSGLFQREQDVDFFVETVLKEGKDNIKPFKWKKKKESTLDLSDGI